MGCWDKNHDVLDHLGALGDWDAILNHLHTSTFTGWIELGLYISHRQQGSHLSLRYIACNERRRSMGEAFIQTE
jgi:hypothetical protein